MKKIYACLGLCSVFLLHGCFDSNNTSDKDEDTSKSSVQLQQKKSE